MFVFLDRAELGQVEILHNMYIQSNRVDRLADDYKDHTKYSGTLAKSVTLRQQAKGVEII